MSPTRFTYLPHLLALRYAEGLHTFPPAILKNASGFSYDIFFTGMGHWAIAQPPTWKARRCNRPFSASHSRGTKPSCWRAKVALGKDKQKTYIILNCNLLCLSCPSASFSLQHGAFCTMWMASCKGPIRLALHLRPAQHGWTHLGPRTKVPTGLASMVIKSHKPPHHVKAQHLGRKHIVSTNAYNHFPRKLPLVRTNLAWLYLQSIYFIPSPFVCILL